MTALVARCQMQVALVVHKIIDARRRRAARDEAFYRALEAYCSRHNVPIVCEDDWRTCRR